jgi:tetratricopeptide (TPR) repeat protein
LPARAAYEERARRLAGHPWWTPVGELELRFVGKELLETGRTADAIDVCRLNAEIHPYVWNVWFNLGEALWSAGRREEAIPCYRRVLEIDPTNFNAPEILPVLGEPAGR